MKKTIIAALVALTATFAFTACDQLTFLSGIGDLIPATKASSSEQTSSEETSIDESLESSNLLSESSVEESSEESSPSEESSSSSSNESMDTYLYKAFTATEKALFEEVVGIVIPFVANNEYYVEKYEMDWEDCYEIGVNFYTFGNTKAEFDTYKALFSDWVYSGTDEDEDGDTWYYYENGDVYVDMSYYIDEQEYIIDVYIYCLYDSNPNDEPSGGGTTDVSNVITNEGKGLPSSQNGVYNVDFTKATPVKDVSDLAFYQGGCPTIGSPSVLVIPVEFKDVTAASKGYSIDKVKQAFNGSDANSDFYSVWEYYYLSSYGKLDLDITVVDSWFQPKYISTYYQNLSDNSDMQKGEQTIIDEALDSLEDKMDLSRFDSDKNGSIDAVVLVNTLDINEENVMYWAYRYWNFYADDEGCYYEYDGVYANDYLWASYQFMCEAFDENGDVYYDENVINTYTFIHELAHVLGAEDYYDTAYVGSPMDGCDIMDAMMGDHNPYTKFYYGWLTNSRLVVAEESVTLTLEAFDKNGDTIIIANNWDDNLGLFQEYYVIMYYRNVDLNSLDMGGGYFARDGILVYHINASLQLDTNDGASYYYVYNTNTDPSSEDGTEDNLIEYVKSPEDTFTYVAGDCLGSNIVDDQGNVISYVFTINDMTEDTATLTFKKNN